MLIIKGTQETYEDEQREKDKSLEKDKRKTPDLTPLVSHIHKVFRHNKDARTNSGIEEDMLMGMRMATMEYSASEKALIADQGGSDIYMPVGATKIRALQAWLKDILLSPKEWPFSIQPSAVPELPEEIVKRIAENIKAEFKLQEPKDGASFASDMRYEHELRRDMQDLILEQIGEEATYSFKLYDKEIKDRLQEGGWHDALDQFIDNFAIFPTAFMKGPLEVEKKKLTWENGEPKEEYQTSYVYKSIHPLDMYLSPSTDDINRGENIEVIRILPPSLAEMKGVDGWIDDAIDKVISEGIALGNSWITEIENEKTDLEKRGHEHEANRDVHIGFHYFGALPVQLLEEYGVKGIPESHTGFVEAEVVLFSSEVVMARLNDDPLLRRPYYASSFLQRAGSVWGMSLPKLLEFIQKMCNASARSLVNNMALAARPITAVNVDRLADDGDIRELIGGDIIQFTSDPYGTSSARPIEFFSAPSNAAELLAIYDAFENKADDASMIPKYAYGGQNVTGAAGTAAGLAMLMESMSKGIKEATRHIDMGLIQKVVERLFYDIMKEEPIEGFSGDIVVITKGSDAQAIRGAQELRRNEFLQITANPIDQSIMGKDGRAQILRVVSEDLGLGENIVPSRLELRKKEKEELEMAQQQAQQGDRSLQATQMQVQGQVAMHQSAKEVDMAKLEADQKKHQDNMALKVAEMEQRKQESAQKAIVDAEKTQVKAQTEDKRIAADLVKNETG